MTRLYMNKIEIRLTMTEVRISAYLLEGLLPGMNGIRAKSIKNVIKKLDNGVKKEITRLREKFKVDCKR